MALVVQQKSYTPAPEGIHAAVCVDVVDLGMKETQWGSKHKCRIVWELAAPMEDGRRFTIQQQFTVSLHEKSGLFKTLKAWRGRPFTAEELAGFDLEKVIGAPCQLVVTHAEEEGKTYANITAIMKADPKNRLPASGKYVRAKDREGYIASKSAAAEHGDSYEEPVTGGATSEADEPDF